MLVLLQHQYGFLFFIIEMRNSADFGFFFFCKEPARPSAFSVVLIFNASLNALAPSVKILFPGCHVINEENLPPNFNVTASNLQG